MRYRRPLNCSGMCLLALVPLCLPAGPVRAQEDSRPPDTGYQVGEDGGSGRVEEPRTVTRHDSDLRVARFTYVSGNVTWRNRDGDHWSHARIHDSLPQGGQVWATDGGRAEIQFDDGSYMRVGGGALVTMPVLFSDADGEFTQLKLTNGLATLRLRRAHSVYQLDTPLVSLKATGPATVRVGAGDSTDIAVNTGKVTVEGPQGKTILYTGDYLTLHDSATRYAIRGLPREDSWDRWNDERDRIADAVSYPSGRVVTRPHSTTVLDISIGAVFYGHSHRHRDEDYRRGRY